MIRVLFSAAMAVCIATAAPAEEEGLLVLEIEGETYDFPLWASQSDWSGSESFGSVNIYARPLDEETWSKFKTFTLGFEYVNGAAANPEASLSRILNGDQQGLFAGDDPEDGGLVVQIEAVAVEDPELEMSGTFVMRMGSSDNFGRDIDMSAPLEITGSFNVVLGPVE